MEDQASDRAREFVDGLQASGRYWFRRSDAAAALGRSPVAVQAALRRLARKGRIISPRRGFHVIVPVEYRAAGGPPASWYIDPLMAHLSRPYYAGLLTAAAIHGASHQQPQVFQVLTDTQLRSITLARVRIRFFRNRRLEEVPTRQVKTETGHMMVSTAEATALDLLRYPEASGHLSNVATVLMELGEAMEPARLSEAAGHARTPDIQRLGYLLDLLGLTGLAYPLAYVLASRRRRPVPLQPGGGAASEAHDPRWWVIPNVKVEPDL